MAGTTHRKDIPYGDFHALHRFRWAWRMIRCDGIRDLGTRHISIPTWQEETPGHYGIAPLKEYPREVYFVPVRDFRRLCRFAGLPVGKVLNVMFRLSMIAAKEGEGESRFLFRFSEDGSTADRMPTERSGYLIEKRRIDGSFSRRRL